MKTLLLLTVVLSSVLAVTAQEVEAVEPVEGKQELQEENLVSVAENEAGEFVPEAEEPEMLSAGEMAPSVKGRFFVCPAGWERYKSSCYLYVSAGKSWSNAAANCNNLGATMASAHDLFEYSFLQQLTRRAGSTVAWMGGLYFQGWRWVDQSPWNYNFWSAHHTVSVYQCLHVKTSAGWANNNCGITWPSICRKGTDGC
ncbi:type-2 ice-structuring protein-like isoform X1 [Platichthys flesus]|uniref:type-2 ice-structuring protein-like isoform X1 n=1 Tax=Platichthys flesus TaxID=8260 RepID=UPI002DBAC287|nr:type-2 ice-structuring protein-like isoform X1 [Platichthys flesus]